MQVLELQEHLGAHDFGNRARLHAGRIQHLSAADRSAAARMSASSIISAIVVVKGPPKWGIPMVGVFHVASGRVIVVSSAPLGLEAFAVVKRSVDVQVLPSPGLKDAPVLDLMCSHFVLTLAAKQGGKFNVRRDLNGLLSLAGRHLVWPAPALARLREFLGRRCKDNEFWRGHEQLATAEFLDRHGVWRGPYEEGTLFFYLDEYAKDQPKDLLSVLAVTGDWLHPCPEEALDAGGEEHRRPVRSAAAEQGRAGAAAVRHAGALPARPAQPAGGVQGQQRARGLRRDRRGRGRQGRRMWARRCAPARGWSASAWSRT